MLPARRRRFLLLDRRPPTRRRRDHPRRRGAGPARPSHARRPVGRRRMRRPARHGLPAGGSPGRRVARTVARPAVPAVAAALAALAVVVVPAPAAAGRPGGGTTPDQAAGIGYLPPVDAPVVDPFRPPAHAYGPGNRGLEYAPPPGTAVRASAGGTVVFAGPVAGALHVTVLHGDGVRTSYSFLAAVEVVVGQRVEQGDRVGTSGPRLHFGARRGDAYFDPATLFAGTALAVELLPFEVPPGTAPGAEIRALAGLTGGGGSSGLPGAGAVVDWLRDRAGAGVSYVTQLVPLVRGVGAGVDLAERLARRRPCSAGPPPARPAGDQRRVAVTVAGLGSSSRDAAVDGLRLDELGYRRDRVVRFSYAGGRTPGTGGALGLPGPRAYTPADTEGDVALAGRRLADLVEQVAAADPEARVDVFAHSLGGVVTRLALVELEARGFDLGRLGLVTTLGAPHGGADAATALALAAGRPGPGVPLDAAATLLGLGVDPGSVAVAQLAEHSTLVRDLAAAGVPAGVRLLSIAARGDLVVAAPRSAVPGATNVVVPGTGPQAHGEVVASDAATAEMARALAGQEPGCEAWHDIVADVLVGHGVSAVEDQLGAAVAAVGG